MTIKLLRCAICLDWHNPSHHCGNCGAYHVRIGRVTKHFNVRGVEMFRAIPIPIDKMINQNWTLKDNDASGTT